MGQIQKQFFHQFMGFNLQRLIMKKNWFYIFTLMLIFSVGAFVAQSIFWYRVGEKGRTWTEHSGYRNETTFTRTRGEFPHTVLTSNRDEDEQCGCVGG